ncbi:MAG: DUF3352 domain-containing protein [Myxococcales bacterium]|nr:DUF3352 domain-containing protein [Myxococcales bacterium]
MFHRLLLAALLVLVASCSKCGKPSERPAAADLTRLLPSDADLVAVAPELGALGQKIAVLEGLKISSFAAQLQGMADAHEYASALMGQLGLDLRSREAIAEAGIDPARPLAIAVLPGGAGYSVVGVKDEAKLGKFLLGLASRRLSAGEVRARTEAGVALTELADRSGAVRLAYAVRDGYALIAAEQSAGRVAAFASLPRERSLAASEPLAKALARLPAERDLWVHLPSSSKLAEGSSFRGLTAAARLSPEALALTADLPWSEPGSLELLRKKAGADLFRYLPADAFLVAGFSGDPRLLAPHWGRLVGPHLERAFKESGFDVKAEILDNLKPGAAASLSLSPEAKLTGMPQLDVRRTNPFRYVHLTALAEAEDEAKLAATFEKMPAIAPRFGASIQPAERQGRKVFLTSYSQGEGVHFAAQDNRAVFAAPALRLDDALERLTSKQERPGPIAEPELRRPFDSRAAALVIDLRRLSESVRELPSEAWGVGGFAIKASTLRWLDAADDLRAVVATADARDGALQAEISLRIQRAPQRVEQQ